jgi:hypothetical protein
MRFQVPQFIEIEDKIFGPLTFRQFVYLVGGAGLCFICYALLPLFIAVLVILPVAAFSCALAFYKVNSKPFISVVEASVKYVLAGKLYIWKKETKRPVAKKEVQASASTVYVPKLSDSKLKDLAWELDIHDTRQN